MMAEAPVPAPTPAPEPGENKDPILKYFEWEQMRPDLQEINQPIAAVAELFVKTLPPGPERAWSLRCLLMAKDAAVRAKLEAS